MARTSHSLGSSKALPSGSHGLMHCPLRLTGSPVILLRFMRGAWRKTCGRHSFAGVLSRAAGSCRQCSCMSECVTFLYSVLWEAPGGRPVAAIPSQTFFRSQLAHAGDALTCGGRATLVAAVLIAGRVAWPPNLVNLLLQIC